MAVAATLDFVKIQSKNPIQMLIFIVLHHIEMLLEHFTMNN
jgi:hypothetical protein